MGGEYRINTHTIISKKVVEDHSKNKLDQTLCAYIGKIYKDITGKGPENIYVAFGDRCYIVYIKNYLMPYEKMIQQNGDMELLDKVMHIATKNINSQIVQYAETITGVLTEETYYDWNIENGSRMLVCMSNQQYERSLSVNNNYYGEQLLHKELIKLGYYADSIPETINSFCLNSKIFIIERMGGTTRLESEMDLKGHGDIIKSTKRQMEKQYLNNNMYIKDVLDMDVVETFIDWDFKKNKSVIMLVKTASEIKKKKE